MWRFEQVDVFVRIVRRGCRARNVEAEGLDHLRAVVHPRAAYEHPLLFVLERLRDPEIKRGVEQGRWAAELAWASKLRLLHLLIRKWLEPPDGRAADVL